MVKWYLKDIKKLTGYGRLCDESLRSEN